ncbi:MgtC/SapB family protein [Natronomonas sp. EA1]|uniref:MgtC/SapB family protein n=1 Tax=Natronomonas sp. EA1 TaxID=3421655 RepID=UPI003EB88456
MNHTVLDAQVARIVLAGALGLFLGLEREWSDKAAGVRTFALISLLAAVFTIVGSEALLVVGGLLVVVMGVLLSVRGLIGLEEGLSLTTMVSMGLAYGVGALVAAEFILEGVTVAVLSSTLLVLKRELHAVAASLSREEVRSATEFAILAFVVFPILPEGEVTVSFAEISLSVEPRIVWLMVVTVAGIGIVNYGVVRSYGGKGIVVTGFFGGLASSTAVVGTMLDHVRQRPEAADYAAAAVLLANAAMALRNLVIAVAFTLSVGVLYQAVFPLAAVILGSVVVAAFMARVNEPVELELETPFRLRYALAFGAVFLVIVVVGGVAEAQFGTVGFYLTAVLAGLVSSAGATTSAVLLYRGGSLTPEVAAVSILLTTASSIAVKAGLTYAAPDKRFTRRVTLASIGLLLFAGIVTLVTAGNI